MKKNLGSADRIIRFTLAVVIAVLYFTGVLPGVWALILGILALVFIATSFVGFCPLYAPFRFSTRKNKEK